MALSKFFIKQGNRKPYLRATLKDGNGSAIDLTGATVAFNMKMPGQAVSLDNQDVDVVNETGGVVEYRWAEGDTDLPGIYEAEFVVTHADAREETVPSDGYFTVEIVRALALPA